MRRPFTGHRHIGRWPDEAARMERAGLEAEYEQSARERAARRPGDDADERRLGEPRARFRLPELGLMDRVTELLPVLLLGAIAGMVALPVFAGALLLALPALAIPLVGVAAVATPLARRRGGASVPAGMAWRVSVYLLVVGVAGIALSAGLGGLFGWLCGDGGCQAWTIFNPPPADGASALGIALAYLAVFAISIVAAYAIDAAAERWARPPAPPRVYREDPGG
jgi:hypothetical protein